MKLKSENHKYTPWIWILIAALIITLPFKADLISTDWLVDNKELIGVINMLVTSCVLILASLFSYHKFFKGRLLKPKMIIEPNVGVIELDHGNLHWIDIGLENKGAVAIWRYTLDLYPHYHTVGGPTPEAISFHSSQQNGVGKARVIDPGETAYEHAITKVPKEIEVVTYRILVKNSDGTNWDRCITVSNRPK